MSVGATLNRHKFHAKSVSVGATLNRHRFPAKSILTLFLGLLGLCGRWGFLSLLSSTLLCWPLALTTNCSCGTDTPDRSIVVLYAHQSSPRGTPSFLFS